MRGAACLPCRERKMRCNLFQTVPCSRCVESGRAIDCVVPPRVKRKILRRTQRQSNDQRNKVSLDRPQSSSDALSKATAALQRENSNKVLYPDDNVLQEACALAATRRQGTLVGSTVREGFSAIEYQNCLDFVSILGQVVLGQHEVNRVLHVDYRVPDNTTGTQLTRLDYEISGLDDDDTTYLLSKNAFDMPPDSICDEFLRVYFVYAFPYAPILDRCDFLVRYRRKQHSSFVMQALLSYAASFADDHLIHRAGYATHQEAREVFYGRALLLFNFDCEKSQLDLLQGCLLLGFSYISPRRNKDYRYWFSNALRIATNMGMHQRGLERELEPRSYKLMKRIWCVILIRDISLSTLGQVNSSQIPLHYNIPDLTEDDFSEDLTLISLDLGGILPHTDSRHVHFLLQMFDLALISKKVYLSILSRDPSEVNHAHVAQALQSMVAWRRTFPTLLWPESVNCWSTQGLWTLIPLAWYARIECHVRRTLWKRLALTGEDDCGARSHFSNAILEFDLTVRRAVLHRLCEYMPLAMAFAVAMNIAFSIELLSALSLSVPEKVICEEAVLNSISYLTQVKHRWPKIREMLRLFSWVFEKKGFIFASKLEFMEFNMPVMMDSSASQGCESLGDEFADTDFLAMFSGCDSTTGMADWLNLPSLSGDLENERDARSTDILFSHIISN